jgi:hypothetical protein
MKSISVEITFLIITLLAGIAANISPQIGYEKNNYNYPPGYQVTLHLTHLTIPHHTQSTKHSLLTLWEQTMAGFSNLLKPATQAER